MIIISCTQRRILGEFDQRHGRQITYRLTVITSFTTTCLLSWMFGRLTLNMKITAAQSLVDLQTSKFTINIRWLSTIILKLNTTDPVNGVSITSNTVHSARIWHRRVSYDFYLLIEPCDSFPSNLKSISGEQIIAKALDCKNQYILYAIGNIFRDYKCVCAIMMTRIRRAVF